MPFEQNRFFFVILYVSNISWLRYTALVVLLPAGSHYPGGCTTLKHYQRDWRDHANHAMGHHCTMGVDSGSIWDGFGADSGSIRSRFGVDLG